MHKCLNNTNYSIAAISLGSGRRPKPGLNARLPFSLADNASTETRKTQEQVPVHTNSRAALRHHPTPGRSR
jgi:hypothetical protein